MKKLALLLFLCSLASAQNFMTVVASHTMGGGNHLLPSGNLIFTATDNSGNPISYQVGGGGQMISFPITCPIVNGTVSAPCQVANVSVSNPENFCYSVTITNAFNQLVLGGPQSGYQCVQPQTSNFWCSAGTCNFDQFVPNLPNALLMLMPPPKSASLGGVYALACPTNQVVIGILSTGYPSCGAGGGSAGGLNTNIQFNNAGAFGGSSNLTWNNSTSQLTVNGLTTIGNALYSGLNPDSQVSQGNNTAITQSIGSTNPLLQSGFTTYWEGDLHQGASDYQGIQVIASALMDSSSGSNSHVVAGSFFAFAGSPLGSPAILDNLQGVRVNVDINTPVLNVVAFTSHSPVFDAATANYYGFFQDSPSTSTANLGTWTSGSFDFNLGQIPAVTTATGISAVNINDSTVTNSFGGLFGGKSASIVANSNTVQGSFIGHANLSVATPPIGSLQDGWYSGTGSPNGQVTAVVSSIYSQRDGGPGTALWVKESGSGNTGWVAHGPVLFSTLAACSSGIEGRQATVTDSTTNTWGATITGLGSNHVLAYCDGTSWTVAAK
jgi:hypothetical protein